MSMDCEWPSEHKRQGVEGLRINTANSSEGDGWRQRAERDRK